MSNLIVTTPEQLKEIIAEEISKHLAVQVTPQTLPDTITINDAMILLEQNGYPTSRAKIYKLTSTGCMPHSKYGNKLVFSRTELLKWADSQTVKIETQAEAMAKIEEDFKRRRK